MTLIEKRDAILLSLQTQFKCRVAEINIHNPLNGTYTVYAISHLREIPAGVQELLLDMANNAAQGMADDGEMS